jgi:hypothetical protein
VTNTRRSISLIKFLTVSLAFVLSTSSWAASAEEDSRQVPPPNDRLHVETEGYLRLTTGVASADEARDIFGVNLYSRNVQPIWLQVENLGETDMWLLPFGIDVAYYTPLETASRHFSLERLLQNRAVEEFQQRKMARMVKAGEVRSGYIFSRVDEGTKSFNVDVVTTTESTYRMTFFIPVPGLRLDHYETEVSVGDIDDMYYSFLRAGWDETETVYKSSLWRTLKSSLAGSDYRYSPVSALYVFGRSQDIALQRTRASIHQRNHLRLWMTPMRFEGQPVWIGQISRDIGVRFTTKTITTHKIDANVDETREFLVEDLFYAQALSGIGYVTGVGEAPYDEPRGNLTGDPYFTDGLRVVMWVSGSPVDLSEIEVIELGVRPQADK